MVGYAGFLLASLGLLGQIYQLGTPIHQALLTWSAATVPVFLLARERWAARFWFLGLATTYGFSVAYVIEHFEHSYARGHAGGVALLSGVLAPFLFFGLGHWLGRREERALVGRELARGGIQLFVVLGILAQGIWYAPISSADRLPAWSLLASLAVLGAAAWLALTAQPGHSPQARRAAAASILVAGVPVVLAVSFERQELSALGAVLSLVTAACFAWAALAFGRARVFHMLTAYIALRMFAVYIEVFGSMLQTGLGLILGGALALGGAWFWHKKSRALAQQFLGARS